MSMKNTGRRGLFGLLAAAPVAAVTPSAKASHDRVVMANDLAISFCKVLGIAPDEITNISVNCKAGDLAKVSIERLVMETEAKMLTRLISHHALVGRS